MLNDGSSVPITDFKLCMRDNRMIPPNLPSNVKSQVSINNLPCLRVRGGVRDDTFKTIFTRTYSPKHLQIGPIVNGAAAHLINNLDKSDEMITIDMSPVNSISNVTMNEINERRGRSNSIVLNSDPSHIVLLIIKLMLEGTISFGENKDFLISSCVAKLNGKIEVPAIFLELQVMIGVRKKFDSTLFVLLRFDYNKQRDLLNCEWEKHGCDQFIELFQGLHLGLLFIVHIQVYLLLVYRTAEFSDALKQFVIDESTNFFSSFVIKTSVLSTDVLSALIKSLKLLKRCSCENFAIQCSVEPSYYLGRIFQLKNVMFFDEVEDEIELLRDCVVLLNSYLYGCPFVRYLH